MKCLTPLALGAVLAAPAAQAQSMGGMAGHAAHGQATPAHSAESLAHQSAGHEPGGLGARGALGDYPMTREASGTAWQPDVSEHGGVHGEAAGWGLMGHLLLNGVYDWQDGPRGDEMAFVSGMVMGSARRTLGGGDTVQLRAMLSPDPLMGKRGYPLLLAAGETADGASPLVDRQHPHDLFMELSASYSRRLSLDDSLFLYVGLPGEPAFGPPAFMHRLSIMDSPEAPISHHWLDSTHIVFGVATLGYVHRNWKAEVSAFKGREPDQHRYDIEAPRLDSLAVRLSWNPSPDWSLQASWAEAKGVELLEPDRDQTKWSASAIHTRPLGEGRWWSTTAAWGRRTGEHQDLDAWVLESAVRPHPRWTLFARAERTDTDELSGHGGHHGPAYTVAKASVGAVRDWPVAGRLTLGLGGLYSVSRLPAALEASYGGEPSGAMVFVRLKLD